MKHTELSLQMNFSLKGQCIQIEHVDNEKVHYCSVDVDSLSLMRFAMTSDGTLRDGSSSVNSRYMQSHAIKTSHFHFQW